MSLGVCLPDLIEQGLVPERQAEEARALYDELVAEHARTGSREAAEALASSAVLDALQRQVDRKAFLAGKTIAVRNRVLAEMRMTSGETTNGQFPTECARYLRLVIVYFSPERLEYNSKALSQLCVGCGSCT